MRIDAHQHFWNPARGDYGWMPKDNKILNRAYTPADLAPLLNAHHIDGTVLVQAAPSIEETEFLLGIADATDFVKAVVGWIDFETPGHAAHLKRFAAHPKFKGVRPMIQDIDDPDWMLREDLAWAFDAIAAHDLTFDGLGYPCHLDNFLNLFKRHPDMRAVIDHGMKPQLAAQYAGGGFLSWKTGLSKIAAETRAYVKLSGLVTEAQEQWTMEDLKPSALHIIEAFGPKRVMWGSDWPVARLRCEYDVWLAAAHDLCAHLSQSDRDRIFGETAREFYHIT